jgi:hypothetical protein
MKKDLLVAGLCLSLWGCAAPKDPPAVSPPIPAPMNVDLLVLDESGAVASVSIPLPSYRDYLDKVLPAAQQGVMNAVDHNPPKPKGGWDLRTVFVGISLKLSVGTDYFGAGASAGLRMLFSNSSEPWVP